MSPTRRDRQRMRPPALPGVSIAEGGPNTRNVTAGSLDTPRVFRPTRAGQKPPKHSRIGRLKPSREICRRESGAGRWPTV